MFKTSLSLLALLLESSYGFMPQSAFHKKAQGITTLFDHGDSKAIEYEPTNLDLERARKCAEEFGKCSPTEIEKLRNKLHEERFQHLLMDSVVDNPAGDLELKVLEEDLAVQESLFKKEIPKASLFPKEDVFKPDDMLPVPDSLEDHIPNSAMASMIAKGETELLKDGLLEENVDEAIVFCLAIAAVAIIPQLINF